MFQPKPTGQERVNHELQKALTQIEKLKLLQAKSQSPTDSTKNKIDSKLNQLKRIKQRLVFLSTKARDKITRFYASNALKEIAEKFK